MSDFETKKDKKLAADLSPILDPNEKYTLGVLKKLWKYIRPHSFKYGIAVASLICVAITNGGFALLMEDMIKAVEAQDTQTAYAPLILLFVFFLRCLSMILSTYYLTWIGKRVVLNIRNDTFKYLQWMPCKLYDTNDQGEFISIVISRTESLAMATSRSMIMVFQDVFTVLGLIGVMLYQSLILSISIFIALPLLIFVFLKSKKIAENVTSQMLSGQGNMLGLLIEAVRGFKPIRIYNAQQQSIKNFNQSGEDLFSSSNIMILISSVVSPVLQFIVMLIFICIVYLSTFDFFNERITSGQFVSFLFALFMTLTPLRRVATIPTVLTGVLATTKTIFDFMEGVKETDNGKKILSNPTGKIEYKDVCFSYGDSKNILKNLTFTAEPNSIVALVGKSGGGKTTALNLIPRFYDYQKGEILIDGQPISDFTLQSLRKNISYVGQDIILSNCSFRENLLFGELSSCSEEDMIQAAKSANAYSFIMETKDGFDTPIGEDGNLLSGGQKQRLSIARAFLKKSKIVIMDEATSALDGSSERKIKESLLKLKSQSTILIIAHRYTTTQISDLILVLQDGKVAESGTHQSLIKKNKIYANLIKTDIK